MLIVIMSFLIVFFAGMTQGVTSFGLSLVAVPLLGLFMPLKDYIPMLILFGLFANLVLFINLKGSFNRNRIIVLTIAGLSSTIIGIYLLKVIDNTILKMAVGILIIILSIILLYGFRIKIRNKMLGNIIAGILSGILNGSLSLSGPPVVLLLSNEGADKEIFRKTLTLFFLVLNIISLPMFFINGLLTTDVIKNSLINLPAVAVGLFLGLHIGNRISENHFRKITLVLIMILGIVSTGSVILQL